MIRMRNMCWSHTAYISDLLGDQLLRPLIIKKAFYAEQLEQLFVLMDAQNAFFNAEVSNWFLYTVRGTGDFAASRYTCAAMKCRCCLNVHGKELF